MKPVRACPICPECGSKHFARLPAKQIMIKCVSCGRVIKI